MIYLDHLCSKHCIVRDQQKQIALAQGSRQRKFPNFLCHKMERDARRLLKAQLCPFTAELTFYATSPRIVWKARSGPVLYGNRFTSYLIKLKPEGLTRKSRNHTCVFVCVCVRVCVCLQMMPEIRVALFGANPNRKFMD